MHADQQCAVYPFHLCSAPVFGAATAKAGWGCCCSEDRRPRDPLKAQGTRVDNPAAAAAAAAVHIQRDMLAGSIC
jgi:hypothetical protein